MRTFAFETSRENGRLTVTAVCIADDTTVEEIENATDDAPDRAEDPAVIDDAA